MEDLTFPWPTRCRIPCKFKPLLAYCFLGIVPLANCISDFAGCRFAVVAHVSGTGVWTCGEGRILHGLLQPHKPHVHQSVSAPFSN